MKVERVALLMSERGSRKEGVKLRESSHAAGIESIASIFDGECSVEEIARHVEALVNEASTA